MVRYYQTIYNFLLARHTESDKNNLPLLQFDVAFPKLKFWRGNRWFFTDSPQSANSFIDLAVALALRFPNSLLLRVGAGGTAARRLPIYMIYICCVGKILLDIKPRKVLLMLIHADQLIYTNDYKLTDCRDWEVECVP